MDVSNSATSFTLLLRIRRAEQDEEAWREFVARYGQRIYQWCLNRRLQPNDAEDVTQNVLVRMAKYLRNFEYRPGLTFRGWLRRATENAIKDFLQERSRQASVDDGSELLRRLNEVEARDELTQRLGEVFDLELMDEAISRVSARIARNRWLAWQMTACEGRPAAEVAAELKMKVASVYTARNQVQKMIREEIESLESTDGLTS